jgi:hypothetical protein
MVPSLGIIQPADHVDPIRRNDEVTVIEVVLFGRKDVDHGAGLLPRVDRLLGSNRRTQKDQPTDQNSDPHESPPRGCNVIIVSRHSDGRVVR